MRPVVGLLLTAFGLLMAVGCALPGGSSHRTQELALRSKRSSETLKDDAEKRLTFKTPSRLSKTVADSGATSSEKPADRPEGSLRSTARVEREPHSFTAGHSMDVSRQAINVSRQDRTASDAFPRHVTQDGTNPTEASEIVQISHVELLDDNANPVQLQGLEVEESRSPIITSKPVVAPWDHAASRAKKGDSRSGVNDRQTVIDPGVRRGNGSTVEHRPQGGVNPRIPHPAAVDAPKSPVRGGALQQASATSTLLIDTPPSWQAQLAQLIARFEQDLARLPAEQTKESHSEYLRKQAYLRLLYLVAERQEEALTAIPQASSSQQEFWQQMIWAMSSSLDSGQFPDADERAAQTLTPLSSALRLMREEAPLSIKNISFCRKISYFGNYERFPRNEFTPGYEVLLYTEIENFTSTPTVDGEYRTSLKSLMEISDTSGKVVWTKGFPPTEDFCRNPRRDYFHNYQFHIPEDLPIGTYSLKLTIVDELSHKRVSSSLGFVLK